jgi:hypothetical protein
MSEAADPTFDFVIEMNRFSWDTFIIHRVETFNTIVLPHDILPLDILPISIESEEPLKWHVSHCPAACQHSCRQSDK